MKMIMQARKTTGVRDEREQFLLDLIVLEFGQFLFSSVRFSSGVASLRGAICLGLFHFGPLRVETVSIDTWCVAVIVLSVAFDEESLWYFCQPSRLGAVLGCGRFGST